MTSRGLHTLVDLVNFTIRPKNVESSFINIRLTMRNIITSNHLRIVGESSKLFDDPTISPAGFTNILLLDESHVSIHCYTDPSIKKCAIDLFTCSTDPINHTRAINDLTQYFINNYDAIVAKELVIERF